MSRALCGAEAVFRYDLNAAGGVVLYHVSEEAGIVEYIVQQSKCMQDLERAGIGLLPL